MAYKELFAPFAQNVDDALSALGEHEYVLLESFIEHNKQLWPVIPIEGQAISGSNKMVASFTLPDAAQVNILFSSAGKMYYLNVALPGAQTLTEITVAGGSTAISADGANNNLYSIAYVNGSLYFAHDGTGPLRVWAGGATYADVPAPGSGYHNAVKYKPYYLTAQNNRLLILGDAAAAVGTQYDVVGSTVTSAVDFTSFGAFYIQLLDTTDKIAGGSIVAGKLIVYKHDSIVIGTTTGDAGSPYFFERYQQSTEQSIGLYAPYSLVNDGGFRDIFESRYGMMIFDGSQLQPCGKGMDDALLSWTQLGGGLSTTPVQAAMGTIYTQGVAYPQVAGAGVQLNSLAGTNKPSRFYAFLGQPSCGITNTVFLMNVDTMQWSQVTFTVPIYGVGALFVGNTDALGTFAPAAQKSLVFGSAALSFPTITQSSVAQPTRASTPTIKIGCGAAIYGVGSQIEKTIKRVVVELQQSPGLTQTAFTITVSLDVGGDMSGGLVNTAQAYATGSNSGQVAYPAVTPTKYTPFVALLDINTTSRTPVVVLSFPYDQTARCWPRISRIAIQYDLGDDN